MTCAHVLGLIDAGSFAGYPRAHLDAAWRHAGQCATCGPALETATVLATDLAAMPQPVAPQHLAGQILAEVSRVEEAREVSARADRAEVRRRRAWRESALVAAPFVAALALLLAWADPSAMDFFSPRVGGIRRGILTMPALAPASAALAATILLYASSLLAPFGGRRDS